MTADVCPLQVPLVTLAGWVNRHQGAGANMKVRAQAALSAKGKLEPFEYDPGSLGPHQVDVRVTHCGICHTDSAMVDNDYGFTQYPLVPGHEAVGVVAAVGPRLIGSTLASGSGSGRCADRA